MAAPVASTSLRRALRAAAMLSLAGLPAAGAAAQTLRIEVGGVERSYLLNRPRGVERPAPAVLILHGGGPRSDAAGLRRLVDFDALAARDGFVAVFPDGLGHGWNDGRATDFLDARHDGRADDVGFLVALADRLAADGVADPKRTYVAGLSNGGMMAFRLACEAAGRFAAVSAAIASLPEKLAATCRPSRPVPLMLANGTADRLVPWAGGQVAARSRNDHGRVLAVDDTVALWRRLDGCEGAAEASLLPDAAPGDGTRIRLAAWRGCRAGAEVLLYTVEGGGHAPPGLRIGPGIELLLGPVSRDADWPELAWAFFRRHALP